MRRNEDFFGDVGAAIRSYRALMKLTRKEFAAQAGISPDRLGRIERGLLRTESDAFLRAAQAAEVDLKGVRSRGLGSPAAADALRRSFCSFDTYMDDRLRDVEPSSRDFVLEELDEMLDDPLVHAGYFLITGDPGIGKTSLISKIVRARHLGVYHFNVAAQGINTPRQFLENVCARLIVEYKLPHSALPEGCAASGAVLNELLCEAAAAERASQEIVIAIDALDEVDHCDGDAGANPLFLPVALPKDVYLVLTARRSAHLTVEGSYIKHYELDPYGKNNEADVRAFIEAYRHRDGIRRWAKAAHIKERQFVEEMWGRSQGNFMYLRHVFRDMERGILRGLTVDDLPYGLQMYYRQHWNTMKKRLGTPFKDTHEPVICLLAVAEGPITAHEIAAFAGCSVAQVNRILKEWVEFLHQKPGPAGDAEWNIYHTAFRDFLREDVAPDLAVYHEKIVERTLKEVRAQRKKTSK